MTIKTSFSCAYTFFFVPSNICLPAAFPRSYFRIMQPILQHARNIIRKLATPVCTGYHSHYHEQAPVVR